jgi:phosphoribosylformylglycinamidine synthase
MKSYTAKVEVIFKSGVLDPQGETIKNALWNLNYKSIESVSTGKLFKVKLQAKSTAEAKNKVKEMADKLLANPVIEDFIVEII